MLQGPRRLSVLDTPPHLSSPRSDIFRLHRLTELLALSQGQLLVNIKWPAPASGSAGSCAPRLLESPAAALRPFLPAPPLHGLPPSNTFTDSHGVTKKPALPASSFPPAFHGPPWAPNHPFPPPISLLTLPALPQLAPPSTPPTRLHTHPSAILDFFLCSHSTGTNFPSFVLFC